MGTENKRKGVRARKIYDHLYNKETRTQKSVTFKTFAVFGVIVAIVVGLFVAEAVHSKSEFNEGSTEVILPEDTHVCSANRIEDGSIRLLDAWITVVEKLIAWQEHDGPELTQADHELGYALTSTGVCGTFAMGYKVSILIDTGSYMLFRFDPMLDFGTETYITPSVSLE